MAAAIAAGNTVIIKPSEVAPACAKFMCDTIPKYLDTVRNFILISFSFTVKSVINLFVR